MKDKVKILLWVLIMTLFSPFRSYAYEGRKYSNINLDGVTYFIDYNGVGVIECLTDEEIKEVTIPDYIYHEGQAYPVDEICSNAFRDKPFLETIKLPSTLKRIPGTYCFSNLPKLTSLEIPDNVEYMNDATFDTLPSLEYLHLGKGLKEWALSSYGVQGCPNLITLRIDAPNPPKTQDYYSQFNQIPKCFVIVPDGSGDAYKQAGGWKYISSRILEESEDADLHKHGEIYGFGKNSRFNDFKVDVDPQTGINNVTITLIDANPLTSLNLPEPFWINKTCYKVIALADNAIKYQRMLGSLTLPSSLISIGSGNLDNAPYLKFIKSLSPIPPAVGDFDTLEAAGKLENLYLAVPEEYIGAYKNSPGWNNFCGFLLENEDNDYHYNVSVNNFDRGTINNQILINTKKGEVGLLKYNYTGASDTGEDIVIPDFEQYTQNGVTLQYPYVSIGYKAFEKGNIGRLTLPESIERIESHVLSYDNVKELVLGSTTPPVCAQDAFDDYTFENLQLTVPSSHDDAYKAHPVWGKFKNYSTKAVLCGRFRYELDKGTGTAVLAGYDDYVAPSTRASDVEQRWVEIPAAITYNGDEYTVTQIAPEALKGFKLDYWDIGISIPPTIIKIGENAFDIYDLQKLKIGSAQRWLELTDTDYNFFPYLAYIRIFNYDDTEITEIVVPEGVTEIRPYQFAGLRGLTSLTLPSTLEKIGEYAFASCGLAFKECPYDYRKVLYIGSHAFSYTNSTFKLQLTSETVVEDRAFEGCGIKEMEFAEGVEHISSIPPINVETLILPSTLKIIADNAFDYKNGSFTTIRCNAIIPPSADRDLFSTWYMSSYNNTKLEIPFISHDEYVAKNSCWRWFLINSTVTDAGLTLPSYPGCKLEALPNNPDCVRFTVADKTLTGDVSIPSGIYIPEKDKTLSVKEISAVGCASLTGIAIPTSISTLSPSAFTGCSSLKSILVATLDHWLSMKFTSPSANETAHNTLFQNLPTLRIHVGQDWASSRMVTDLKSFPIITNTIAPETFTHYKGFKDNLEIPAQISVIGENAFTGSTFNTLTLNGTDSKLVADGAFDGSEITRFHCLRNVSSGILRGVSNVKEAVLDGRASIVTKELFAGHTTLADVTLGASIHSIESRAFQGTALREFPVSDALSTICDYAYEGMVYPTHFEIPASVTMMGSNIFKGCTSLKQIAIARSSQPLNGASSFTGLCLEALQLGRPVEKNLFEGIHTIETLNIGSNVTTLPRGIFSNIEILKIQTRSYTLDLTEAGIIPVAEIAVLPREDNTFTGISTLRHTDLPNLYVTDGSQRYTLCTAPDGVGIDDAVFSEKGTHLLIPNHKYIAKTADKDLVVIFRNMLVWHKICTPEGFSFEASEKSGDNVFEEYDSGGLHLAVNTTPGNLLYVVGTQNAQNVSCLTISGQINGTDVMVINRMQSLKYLDITDADIVAGGVTYYQELITKDNVVGSKFFFDLNLEGLSLPVTATVLDEEAIAAMAHLKWVELSPYTTSIGKSAFISCTSLDKISLPPLIETIGDNCFNNCTALTTVELPPLLKEISPYCFNKCSALEEVSFTGNDVSTIGAYAFEDCETLHTITLPLYLKRIDGRAFANCTSLETVNFPQHLEDLGASAFANCNKLEAAILPESLKKLGEWSFSGCSSLGNVYIPRGLDKLMDRTFRYCTALPRITIPGNIKTIGMRAFENCESLEVVNMELGIEAIGEGAFIDCNIHELVLPTTVHQIGSEAFSHNAFTRIVSRNPIAPVISSSTFDYDTKQSVTLEIPSGSLAFYWSDPIWREFLDIKESDYSDFSEIYEVPILQSPGVQVFTLDGQMVYSGTGSDISLNPGIYIICAGNVKKKILVTHECPYKVI